MRSHEITEPTADGIGVNWHTVRLGEQSVAVYPSIAHTQSALSLPSFILFEQLDGDSGRFDVARGAVVLGGVGDDALMRNVERGTGDADDGGLEVNVFPLQPTQLLPSHTREHEHLDHRAVLHVLAVKQREQPGGLFLVEVSRRGLFLFREGGTLAWIARYQPPFDRYSKDGGQERMVVADGVVGERLVLAVGGEGLAHRELERLADRRSGLFGNVVTVQCVAEC